MLAVPTQEAINTLAPTVVSSTRRMMHVLSRIVPQPPGATPVKEFKRYRHRGGDRDSHHKTSKLTNTFSNWIDPSSPFYLMGPHNEPTKHLDPFREHDPFNTLHTKEDDKNTNFCTIL